MAAPHLALIFIINGVPHEVRVNANQPLQAAISHVLAESGNQGRPEGEWTARSQSGTLLDPSRKIEDLGLEDGGQIFLALSAGVGG